MKNAAWGSFANAWIASNPCPHRKSTARLHSATERIRRTRVSGYQRDSTPLPFSPAFIRLAPLARIPPRYVLFFRIVRNARSGIAEVRFRNSRITASREISNDSIFLHNASWWPPKMHCQTEETSSSISLSTSFSDSPSRRTLRGILPPPRKGSTKTRGRTGSARIQPIMKGTSQVLPPG